MAVINTLSGGIPLTIIAGVPSDKQQALLNKLKKYYSAADNKSTRQILFLSGLRGGCYRKHIINTTIDNLYEYISSKRKDLSSNQFTPTHISVAYLESQNEEENFRLIDSFFTFAQLVRIKLERHAWSDYSEEELYSIFVHAIDNIPSWMGFQGMCGLTLPLKNFKLSRDKTLHDLCLEQAHTLCMTPSIIKDIIIANPCKKDSGTCPHCPHKKGKVPKDDRGLCFVRGGHGFPRQPEDGKFENHLVYINSLYRFGLPLQVTEYYDVQFEGGKKIGAKTFVCSVNGETPKDGQSCRYANIYPNDYIRIFQSK